MNRPNAIDREVDALTRHQLLTANPLHLFDPDRVIAAVHLADARITVWLIATLLQIAVLAWFWRSGWCARYRDELRRRIAPEFNVRFVLGATLALIARGTAFLPQLVQYRLDRSMNLTDALTRTWFGEWAGGTVLAMLAAGALAAIVLRLADRTHQWYLYTIAGLFGGTLLVSYAAPLGTHAAYPLPGITSVASAQLRVRAATGVAVPVAAVPAGPTHVGRGFMLGWGGTQRLVLTQTRIAGSTASEILFDVASAAVWILRNDGLHVALIRGGSLVLGTALAVFIADRVGFRRDDDPVSRLALLGAIMGGVYLVGLPFYNGYERALHRTDDLQAIALTRDPTAAIRATVRYADQALVAPCGLTLSRWYFGAYPEPADRIAYLQGRKPVCVTSAAKP